jgi:large subunit ribosomal protein L24
MIKSKDLVKVKGINIIKKHEKTTKEKKGGIISKENFIHISNLINLELKNEKKGIAKK